MRYIGAASRGIRLPVITKGADLINIISDTVIAASENERDPFVIRDKDIVGVTESLLARSQGKLKVLTLSRTSGLKTRARWTALSILVSQPLPRRYKIQAFPQATP